MRTIISIAFIFSFFSVWAQGGIVRGKVQDAETNEPLPFVNVVILGTQTGAVSDLDGNFQFFNVKPGFIRLTTSFIGYKNAVSADLEVSNANPAYIEIKMEKSEQKIGEVTVTASPFRKTEESPVSLRSIGVAEIETNPGANRDISKVIQSFPGVASTPAFRNDVIIRGGGPSESVFYLDGIEVPNINHFATQGASGGPVGIINADFIREVNYYSGAFPANRSDALSGVLEFNQVDGNNEKTKFRGSLGASELTATLDGPLNDKTTYIVSTRRSYLKFLFGIIELPFLPTFNDMQFKVRTRIDAKNEITFVGLGAIDLFDLNKGIENPDEQQQYILSYLPVNEQWTYTIGGVYKHFHSNGFSTVALSRNHLNNRSVKYFDNEDSNPDALTLDYLSEEIENKLRVENTNRVGTWKLNYGANLDVVRYTNETYQKRFFQGQQRIIDYETDLGLVKWGLFAQTSKNLMANALTLSAGIRFDANNYASSMSNPLDQFSPRISASYNFTSEWSLNANVGRYFQLPPYTSLGFKRNDVFVNQENELKYIRSDHFITGVEYRPSAVVQFSTEGFLKTYANYPYSVNDGLSLANKGADYGVLGDEEVVSTGEGRAYGVEFLARINNQKNLNGNISYTLVRSEFIENQTGEYIPSTWDSKHLVSIYGTYRMKNDWSVGGKWRFVGGLPYTPFDLEKSALIEAWEATGAPYPDLNQINRERLGAFHQLDLRVDKAFYLKRLTAKFYLDIQNAYNFQAENNDIVVRQRDANGNLQLTPDGKSYVLRSIKNTSGTVLPTIGIIIEL